MIYEVKNHSINALNQRIKTELIQSQRLQTQDPNEAMPSNVCYEQLSCRLKGLSVQQKIGFEEEIIPMNRLTQEIASLQVQRLLLMLRMHRIVLLFTGANQDPRDQYSFIVGVFMKIELPPHPPEMQFCFMYDTLGDEHISNPETLVGSVFEPLLQHERTNHFKHMNNRVKLNAYDNLSEPELHYVVDRYKQKYAWIQNREIRIESKRLLNDRLHIKGLHHTIFCNDAQCDIIHAQWHLELIPINGTWRVVNIQIEGVEF